MCENQSGDASTCDGPNIWVSPEVCRHTCECVHRLSYCKMCKKAFCVICGHEWVESDPIRWSFTTGCHNSPAAGEVA
jgi:hypothetical protein